MKIGITQRVAFFDKVNERRDMLDQRWHSFASSADLILYPMPNNSISSIQYVESLNVEGLIFSGGNNIGISKKDILVGKNLIDDDVAYERDKTELELLQWAIENNIPVIGVCRGFQFINEYFGGKMIPVEANVHVAQEHKLRFVDDLWQKHYGDSCNVNSFHNYGINDTTISADLHPAAYCGNIIEAASHKLHKIIGLFWHPERNRPFKLNDIQMIKDHFQK